MPSSKFRILFCIILLPISVSLLAQSSGDLAHRKSDSDARSGGKSELENPDYLGQAFESAIDGDTYIVGPGDVFNIELEGMNAYNGNVTLSPEGKLILPTLGIYDVNGKSVNEVRRIVAENARTKYIGGKINVNLVGVRSIRVHVTGQVLQPGTYRARAVFRISDLITLAGGLNRWANARAVELRREGGATRIIDYYSFLAEGKLDENVHVQGGDVIHVPSVYRSDATVQVEGRVQNPGMYAIRPDESAEEFLFRVNAPQQNADMDHAVVIRKSEVTGEMQEVPLFVHKPGNGKSIALQPNDIVRIPARRDSVYVQGDCQRPGSYPFQAGWHARDYAGLAGPKDTAVSPKGIKVVRAASNKTIKGPDIVIERGDTIIVPSNTRKKLGDIFGIVAQLASITYFVVITREQILNK